MKVINIKTGNIFELSQTEAEKLITEYSSEFAEYVKDGYYIKKENIPADTGTISDKISDI